MDDGCTAPSRLTHDLFVPLAVWFFITVATATAGGGYIFIRKQWRAASGDGQEIALGPTGRRGSAMMDYDYDAYANDAGAYAKESWAIAFKELRVGKRIGAGNVGEVYRGLFRMRQVAIKKLLPSWTKDDDMIGRFREEILLMSTMNHPNVLGFVGAVMDRDAGNIALVTELCERGTLYDLLHSSEPLPWGRRLRMARDIAMGMDYLHTKAGIIQRDLKSANLLVTRSYEIRVADFGLSRELDPGRMGTYCGTPSTMAPEIVRQEAYSEKADVFSFAIILWELLTRSEPYAGQDGLALAYAVANDGLRPPIPAYCPAEWAALMVRSWDDDPAVRPSFDELQRELLRLARMLDAPSPPVPALSTGGSASGFNAGQPLVSPSSHGQLQLGGDGDFGFIPGKSSPLALMPHNSPVAAEYEDRGPGAAAAGAVDARGRFRLQPATDAGT